MHVLVLHCMTLTLEELEQRKEQLRHEIMERECILAALEVLHRHAAGGRSSKTIEVSTFLPALLTFPGSTPIDSAPIEVPKPAALPPPPPPERYIHPELKEIGYWQGRNTRLVQWAIRQLPGEFTIKDIFALLEKEGGRLESPEISVVLSRLKQRKEIVEIREGRGRTPAVFRNPSAAAAEKLDAAA